MKTFRHVLSGRFLTGFTLGVALTSAGIVLQHVADEALSPPPAPVAAASHGPIDPLGDGTYCPPIAKAPTCHQAVLRYRGLAG